VGFPATWRPRSRGNLNHFVVLKFRGQEQKSGVSIPPTFSITPLEDCSIACTTCMRFVAVVSRSSCGFPCNLETKKSGYPNHFVVLKFRGQEQKSAVSILPTSHRAQPLKTTA